MGLRRLCTGAVTRQIKQTMQYMPSCGRMAREKGGKRTPLAPRGTCNFIGLPITLARMSRPNEPAVSTETSVMLANMRQRKGKVRGLGTKTGRAELEGKVVSWVKPPRNRPNSSRSSNHIARVELSQDTHMGACRE